MWLRHVVHAFVAFALFAPIAIVCSRALVFTTSITFEKIWQENRTTNLQLQSLWRITPPAGYFAMWDVISHSMHPPAQPQYVFKEVSACLMGTHCVEVPFSRNKHRNAFPFTWLSYLDPDDGHPLLVAPIGFQQVMDAKDPSCVYFRDDDQKLQVFRLVCPNGYTHLGDFATSRRFPPPIPETRCISLVLTSASPYLQNPVWTSDLPPESKKMFVMPTPQFYYPMNPSTFHVVDPQCGGGIDPKGFSSPFRAVASTTLTPSNKATSCITRSAAICPPGSYSPFFSGIEFCVACPYDTYSDKNGSTSCESCPTGTRTFFAGSRSVSECRGLCPPGYFNPYRGLNFSATSMGLPCAPCPYHTYADKAGMSACIPCPVGRGIGSVAAMNRSQCSVEELENFDELIDCFTEDETKSGKICEDYCPPGFFSSSGLKPCSRCPPDTEAFKFGSKACSKNCPAGSFSVNGANFPFPCRLCPRGTYQFFDTSTNCIPCPLLKGTIRAGSTNPSQCTDICLPSMYSSTGDEFSIEPCRLCPPGRTTVSMGARALSDCLPVDTLLRIPFRNSAGTAAGISPYAWPVPSRGLVRADPDLPQVGIVATLRSENASASFPNGITVKINGLFCKVLTTSVIRGHLSVLFVPPEWSDEVAAGRIAPTVAKSDFTGPSVLEISHSLFQYEIARSSTLFVMYDSDVVGEETEISPNTAPSGYTCKPKVRVVLPPSLYVREYASSTICQFFFSGDPSWRSAGVIDSLSFPPFDIQPTVQRTAMICLGFDGLPFDKGVSVTMRVSIDQIFLIDLKKKFIRVGLNNLSFAYPQSGSSEGGTVISIIGSGFGPYLSNPNRPLCKFSSTPIKGYTTIGRFFSDSSLICVSPSARALYPALQLAPFPIEEVTTTVMVSMDGSGIFCLEPCRSLMLGQQPCADPVQQIFTFVAPPSSSFVIQWVHCSQVSNGCPRPFTMDKLGYVGCFFQSGSSVSLFTFAEFSQNVCIRALPSSAGSTYTFLTYADGWATETGKYVAFVPHFTLGRCVERGPMRAQVFNIFKSSETPGSLEFLRNLLSLRAMKPFRQSDAASVLLNEFMNSSFLDPHGSVVQVHVDFTVGVLNNYSMNEKTYGCSMPKSQSSQFVHEAVSTIEKLNPTGLNTTKIEEQDRAIFCGHLAFSINCIGFDYESCLSKILLPMQTDGLLPFRNTRSRLRYSSFSSWCQWHLPETQNVANLSKSKKLHACNTCRQSARICSQFPARVIAAEISLNCSNAHTNLDPTAELSVACDEATDSTFCSVTNRLCVRSSVDPLCAKHDVFGSCFNSVTIDPSSLNSGQKLGYQDQTPRLNITFNITT